MTKTGKHPNGKKESGRNMKPSSQRRRSDDYDTLHAGMHQFDDWSTSEAAEFSDNMAQAAHIWHKIVQETAQGFLDNPSLGLGHTDPFKISESFTQLASKAMANPNQIMDSQIALWQDHLNLWQSTTQRLLGHAPATAEPEARDRRFKDEAWNNSTYFDFLKRSYLINSRWIQESVASVEGLDRHTADKVNFFTRQFLDAMSPSNYFFTNPEVIRETLVSKGENMVKGMKNMLEDVMRGQGKLRISMTDENAFTLGENIAATPGKVIYENDLMQLIQYTPSTKQVYEVPLLIMPAWINKYYVLDMREENSFIRWAIGQGYTVFVMSWVNPNAELGRKSFDDYLSEGPLSALDVIEEITGSDTTNVVGYCLGGTLLSITLAYLRTHGQSARINSATYLTTMIDFSQAGDLSVFIDDEQLESLEDRMSETGYLEAQDMATTFNMLRANDLIWSFVVNNYLMGKDPFPFDLLYWNSDSTRMPATMHSFYLRNMYQKNLLIVPGGLELLDTPINITKIQTPSYILSTIDDHISPWKSTYAATQIYDGDITFTLAQSGHIAGVISPPGKKKYGFWTNKKLPARPQQWLEDATFKQDSWWLHWHQWQAQKSGDKVKARKLGSARYKPIEKAPGSYAKVRV